MNVTPHALQGVLIAVNAFEGVCAVFDAPRCESYRSYYFDSQHDWYAAVGGSGPWARDRKVFSPHWMRDWAIRGSREKLAPVLELASRRRPEDLVLVVRGFLSALMNTDIDHLAADLSEGAQDKVVLVDHGSMDDDWIDGWQHAHDAIWSHLVREDGSSEPHVSGFCLFRREGDEVGNVLELERAWRGCGFPTIGFPGSGRDAKPFRVAPTAPTVRFPFARSRPLVGDAVDVPLPIGLENTCSMLRTMASAFGREAATEEWIATELAALRSRIEPFVARSLAGKGAIVLADPWTAAGLSHALRELAAEPVLVVVLRRSSATDWDRAGLEEVAGEIMVDPEHQQVGEKMAELASCGLCDVVVGSGMLRDAAARVGLGYVEVTAPHYLDHFMEPSPYMGFRGFARLAERLSHAILTQSHARALV